MLIIRYNLIVKLCTQQIQNMHSLFFNFNLYEFMCALHFLVGTGKVGERNTSYFPQLYLLFSLSVVLCLEMLSCSGIFELILGDILRLCNAIALCHLLAWEHSRFFYHFFCLAFSYWTYNYIDIGYFYYISYFTVLSLFSILLFLHALSLQDFTELSHYLILYIGCFLLYLLVH